MTSATVFQNTIFNWCFGLNPYVLAFIFFFYGAILIIVCGKNLRSIELIEAHRRVNVGYLHSFNWSITYTLIIPSLIYQIADFYQELFPAIKALIISGTIRAHSVDIQSSQYIESLEVSLQANETLIISLIFVVTVLINIYDFFSYFLKKDKSGYTQDKDWTNVYQGWHKNKVSFRHNMVFNFFAYFMQWLVVFVCVVFAYKVVIFLSKFYSLLGNADAFFSINLNLSDPIERLGLWPLQPLVEAYIRFVLMLALYLVLLRFIHVSRKVTWEYAPRLVAIGGSLAIIFLFLVPIMFFGRNVDNLLRQRQAELSQELLHLKNMQRDSVVTLESLLRHMEATSLEQETASISKQSILPLSTEKFYVYLAISIVLLRLILKPPESWVELVTGLLGENK